MDISVSMLTLKLQIGPSEFKMARSEIYILKHLALNKGKVSSKQELASVGWEGRIVSNNSVPVAIGNIRKITEKKIITTIDGGYCLENGVSVVVNDELEPEQVNNLDKYKFKNADLKLSILFLFLCVGGIYLSKNYFIANYIYSYENDSATYLSYNKTALSNFFPKDKLKSKKLNTSISGTGGVIYVINFDSKTYIIDCINKDIVKSFISTNPTLVTYFLMDGNCEYKK